MHSPEIALIHTTTPEQSISLGLNYIHAYLTANNHRVTSIFINQHQTLALQLNKLSQAIVGLQLLTTNRTLVFAIIETIHKFQPQTKIIVGGMHATIMYKQILLKYPFLIIVRGEGEQTFLELINTLVQDKPLQIIPGLAFFEKENVHTTAPRKTIQDLDQLPFPHHSNTLRYAACETSILTSRGCPFNCSFCCSHNIGEKSVRYRSIPNVIQELKEIQKKYPQITTIQILDDTFLLDNNRAIDFCNEILRHKLHFKFTALGRAAPLSEILVQKLEAAGFITIGIGLESGNDAIRKNTHKNISTVDILNAVKLFAKTKINIQVFAIIGLPGETKETLKETARLIQKIQRIKYIYYWHGSFPIAIMYPGTELYKKMLAAKATTENIWLSDIPEPLYTLEHTEKTLREMQKDFYTYTSLDYFFTRKGFFRQLPIILTSSKRGIIIAFLLKIFILGKHPRLARVIKKQTPHWLKSFILEHNFFRDPTP